MAFLPISDVFKHEGKVVDLIGVVADLRPPTLSRGSDYTVSFTICDRTKSLVESGLLVRMFHPIKEQLPQIEGVNDIVILKSVKISRFHGNLIGLSTHTTSWIVGGLTPVKKQLQIKTSSSTLKPTQTPQAFQKVQAANGRKRKFAHIKDMQYDSFYDLMGEVVKTFPSRDCFTIYMTDYTKNPNLYCYELNSANRRINKSGSGYGDFDYNGAGGGTSSKWNGPFGQYTLQVTLWDVHGEAARKFVKEGIIVRLSNVRAKRNGDGHLEGTLSGDRMYPDRVDVKKVEDRKDPLVQLLYQRQREYIKRIEAELVEYEGKKREEERQREIEAEEEKKQANELNPNIVTRGSRGTPIMLVGDILKASDDSGEPYINRNYRTICRVIDYLPNHLEQFCCRKKQKPKPLRTIVQDNQMIEEFADGSTKIVEYGEEVDDDDDADRPESQRHDWEFRFALLVEGTDGATMRLMVDNHSAQHLLNMDATDLTKNHRQLAQLREKLFVLWGDLEERKSAKLARLMRKHKQRQLDASEHSLKRRHGSVEKNSKRRKRHVSEERERERDPDIEDTDEEKGEEEEEEEEEEDNGMILGRGRLFAACVREYGVKKVDRRGNVMWNRMFGLFGVMIK
ncbi:hypothetical protein BDZ91DRAFT_712949 [Kalaharituber pfeilii]|nr:hypothetical protein BDZ91DRAFT_712949 [Kalaharituber pfeilii]